MAVFTAPGSIDRSDKQTQLNWSIDTHLTYGRHAPGLKLDVALAQLSDRNSYFAQQAPKRRVALVFAPRSLFRFN